MEITGGNAEVAEKNGIAKKAIRKSMQGKKLKIDGAGRIGFATEAQKNLANFIENAKG